MINNLVFHFYAHARFRQAEVAAIFIEKMKRNSTRAYMRYELGSPRVGKLETLEVSKPKGFIVKKVRWF